jgi:hypothetical protein
MKNTARKDVADKEQEVALLGSDALPEKQEAALAALLSQPTLKEAALAAGISPPTLWRYMQDPAFSKRLREARRELVSHAVLRLQNAVGDAVRVLHDIVNDAGVPAAVRVTAACAIYKQAVQVVEADELKQRVEDLEAFIKRKREQDELAAASGEEGDE